MPNLMCQKQFEKLTANSNSESLPGRDRI